VSYIFDVCPSQSLLVVVIILCLKDHEVFCLLVVVILLLKHHEVNYKHSTQKKSLMLCTHIHRPSDAKGVSISAAVLESAIPHFGNLGNFLASAYIRKREVDVTGAATDTLAGAERAHGVIDLCSSLIIDAKVRLAARLLHVHLAQLVALAVLDVDGVAAAAGRPRAPAAAPAAAERTLDAQHFLLHVVCDVDDEAALRPTAHALADGRLFKSIVDLLVQTVHDPVLVLAFPANKHLKQLHDLLADELVHLGQVLQARGHALHGGGGRHQLILASCLWLSNNRHI